jgi:site-specific DNA-cytosine methylase
MENVKMKKEFEQYITHHTEQALPNVYKYLINSALVSAQSRQRYYWTNIPGVEQPEDRGIVLRDILEDDFDSEREKSYCIDANYYKGASVEQYENKSRRQLVKKPKPLSTTEKKIEKNKRYLNQKSAPLLASTYKGVGNNGTTLVPKIETKPKQVGIAADINGHDVLKQVYSPEGKSPTLNAHGGGNTEPKVVVSKIREKSKTVRSGGRDSYDRHEWDSVDELHWRKLTPLECERLQTVPDNYTNHVSNTQRYKMLGNGWTVDVIAHIFTFMQRAHNGEHLVTKGQINLDL